MSKTQFFTPRATQKKYKNGRIFYFSSPLIELSFTLQHDHREFAMFRVYFPLFI